MFFSLLLVQTIALRDYQKKLLEVCICKNSILYLPTGSGKTLIAAKLIETFSDDLKIPLDKGGKRSLFLVTTVCLGRQVAEEIRNLLGLEVALWNSETHKTTWSAQRYKEGFEKSQVFVATAQLFLDAVKHHFISIEQINVIIFDECHHGRMNHPYHELMKMFKYIEPTKQPRILGLTGMLIGISSSITVETVNDELKALESTFLSTIVTVHRLEDYKNVLIYSTNPKESFIKYLNTPLCELQESLIKKVGELRFELSLMNVNSIVTINPQTLRKTRPKKLKELEILFEDFKCELKEMGIYGGYIGLQGIRVKMELVKRQPKQHKEILNFIDICLDHVKELMEMIEDKVDFKNVTTESIVYNSSMKVRTLLGILKQKFGNPQRDSNLQCLIFVQRRFSAKCLYHLFKRYAELDDSFPIKPDFVVGVNAELPESIDEILNLNENHLAIEKFRKKITNCVFTSSVMEEGMDLQSCNLVVMYDRPMTFRSYVQSKGRARTKDSDYIVLLPVSDLKFLQKRELYLQIDVALKKTLIGKTCDRALSEDGIEKERLEIWDPLITNEQALVNSVSAVALLNRYVSRWTNANCLFDRIDIGPGKIVAIVHLPRQSKIKHAIRSDPFDDIKFAKQNAAFKACSELFRVGELDENLMPNYI